MTNDDQVAEIAAFYDKLSAKLAKEHHRDVVQLQKARDAALKVFGAGPPPAANGNGAKRTRGPRLSADVQKAILGAMSSEVGYTAKEIGDLSHAGRSQVRTTLELAMKSGTVAGDAGKRNRKFVLTTAEAANA
jgi:hypothetical protein